MAGRQSAGLTRRRGSGSASTVQVTTVLFVTTNKVVDMETSRWTPRQSWLFVALSGVLASVAVGGVVSLMFAVGYAVSNERVKQALLDLLSLLP